MESLYTSGLVPPPLTCLEYEQLIFSFLRGLENANAMVRKSFAETFASILAISQKPAPVPKIAPKTGVKVDTQMLSTNNILSVTDLVFLLPKLYMSEFTSFGMSAKPITKEIKIAIIESFACLFRKLGVAFMEGNYPVICKMLIEFAAHPKHTDKTLGCEMAGYILRETIGKVLSETGQLLAIKELALYLKRWPAVKGSETISDASLVVVLEETSALLYELGPAAVAAQDEIVTPLLKLTIHPTIAVKLSTAQCLRSLSLALPHLINKLMSKLVVGIQKDMNSLSPETAERFVGYSFQLSAVIRTIPLRSLFASYDDAAQIFSLSTQMLRAQFSAKDFRIMTCQAQVAWTLIGSLMSLGHNFVKVHISQLLLIWKNGTLMLT
jgi:HEAT repeat-containing protein 5